jgi:hypothetical protein
VQQSASHIEEHTRPQGEGIGPRGVEGTRLQGVERPRREKEEGTAPQEGGIVQAQAHPWEEGNVPEVQANLWEEGNVPEVQANLWAVGKALESQGQLGQLGRLEWRVQQQGAGTGPRGVGIGRMEPQGVDIDQEVDIDPGAGNSLDKHMAEAAGSIGLGVGNIQVVLVVRHILDSRVVGQAHQLGVGRALDPLEARLMN